MSAMDGIWYGGMLKPGLMEPPIQGYAALVIGAGGKPHVLVFPIMFCITVCGLNIAGRSGGSGGIGIAGA